MKHIQSAALALDVAESTLRALVLSGRLACAALDDGFHVDVDHARAALSRGDVSYVKPQRVSNARPNAYCVKIGISDLCRGYEPLRVERYGDRVVIYGAIADMADGERGGARE